MNLPRSSIRHPVTVVMIVLVLLTIGLMALMELPTDMFPEITFPVISVVTRYTGAAPEEVETLVTEPLEEALSIVHGVTKVNSVSQHNLSMINLEFDWGANLDEAANDVRDAVQYAKRFLPDDVPQPAIVKIDLSKMPIWIGTLRGNRSLPALERLAEKIIKPRLARIDGVAALGIIIEEKEEVLVEAQPKALEVFGIGLERLLSLLLNLNRNVPGGDIHAGGRTMPVRTMGESSALGNLATLPLFANPDGSVVTLGQVAGIRRGIRKQDTIILRNGGTCLALNVMKQSGKNSVQVLTRVNAELERIRPLLPADVHLETVFDQAEFINKSINAVSGNLVLGGFLALAVLYFFCQTVSYLLIIGLAIPLSVIVTFIPIYFLKYSLNMMTLGGLALGVGMLVDNGIVVMENIDRHLAMGKSPHAAAEEGAREVGPAITGSTLTTIVVFLPFVFFEGIAARLFGPLGVTVSVSLLSSLVLSLTLVPTMAAYLIRPGGHAPETIRLPRYRRAVTACLNRPVTFLVAIGLLFTGTVFGLSKWVGWEYIPVADDGMISTPFRLPVGLSLEESRHALEPLVRHVASDSRVFSVFERLGLPEGAEEAGVVIGLADANEGEIFIKLVPKSARKGTTREFIEEMRPVVARIPGLEMNLRQSFETLFSAENKAIVVHLQGNDLPTLHRLVAEVRGRLAAIPGIRDLESNIGIGRPELRLQVKRELAIKAGLTQNRIGEMVRTALQGRKVGVYRDEGDEFFIRLVGPTRLKEDPEALLDLPLETTNPGGSSRMTTLRQVAVLEHRFGEEKLHHRRQLREATVSANYAERPLGAVMAEARKTLAQVSLPEGYTLDYSGIYEDLEAAIKQLAWVFAMGLLLVYMIMASEFESFKAPFCILFSVPLAASGLVIALWLWGQTFNVSSALGLIILLGVVVNNAIVLVEFVGQRRDQGLTMREALVEAASVRLRPIFMTTITTVLGLLPLAMGFGEGTEIQQPMAVAIIGGLSFSTVLTLFVIPCVYLLLHRRECLDEV